MTATAKKLPPETSITDGLVTITEDTLLGDLLQLIIDEIKAAPDVWQKMSQDQQDDMIDRAKRRLTTAVEQSVTHIVAAGRPVITADVDSVTFKDGIKAVLKVSQSNPLRHELADATGLQVLVVVTDIKRFSGGTEGVKSDDDQPGLPLDD